MSLHKRRRVVPLVFFILLLTLPALLFIYYTCPCTSTTTASSPSITLLQTPTPNFTFTIKLLAYDRIDSVSRCLRSLANADYGNDRVNLHVFIDHFKQIANSSGADVDKKLEESHRILNFVNGFAWGFGDKLVHYRTGNVGLQAQWLEAWWPSSDDDFAFVVEDDLEISPLFYRFLRGLIDNYYYNSSNYSPFVYGASLQRPRFVPGKHGNKLQLDSETRLFMYQLVGTWGQLLFPKPWKEFRIWYDTHKEKGIKPILQGMVTTGWYKKMGERIWTPWFIKFIHSRGYFNIYTNFLRERALSVSHRDAGVNYGKTAGPDSKLLDEISLDFKLLEMPALSNLKWYDFCFREVLPGRIVTSFDELGSVLYSVQKHKTVILVSLFEATHIVIKNMLCHFERLDIQNYILVGPRSDFLFDLARRGHPVIDADQLLNSIKGHRLKGFQESQHELIKETMVEAYVIKMCVETKHNVWVIDGNVLLTSNDTFSEVDDLSCDISATKNSKLLFVRSSSTTAKVWDDEFIEKVATRTSSFISENSLSKDDQNFRYIVGKTIEEIGTSIRRFDELSFGSNIGMSTGDGKKMVFWPMEMNLDKIQKRLTDLGMWAVDGEGSCMAVICHQS